MKSFLELVEEKEATHKPVVMSFGRMNPPTTGHLKLIDKVRSTAEKLGAKHTVIVSHSQDSKKNPLSGEQKVKHLKRYSPGTHFQSSSKEHPTIMHHASDLHSKGYDHLHVVAGSDRVKEMHALLHKYNGVKGSHGHYNFKKITVHSAGHRDPDAEGAEGMSGTKMREHAKNKDFSSFRQGVPAHVPDHHARELMHDVRKGMGLHESVERGQFKAIFVTGGPGSGKDIIIREAIAESKIVELNFIQARDYLGDKQKLSEQSKDFRKEAIRNRGPLIINGPADDMEKISYIKEELEELGYETLMIFVNTTNEISQERNSLLSRMMVESIRNEKWNKSQENVIQFNEMYNNFIEFDNTGTIDTREEDIDRVYNMTKNFLDVKTMNETAFDWLDRNNKLNINDRVSILFKEDKNVKKTNRFVHIKTTGNRAEGPADIPADNRAGDPNSDNIKWDAPKRTKTYTFKTYSEGKNPTLTFKPVPKESNFSKDKDKEKRLKQGDRSGKEARIGKPAGVGPEFDTRTSGQGLTGGAGLGNQTYSEDQEYSNANPASTAMPSGGQPNPLSGDRLESKVKDFKKFRKQFKEAIDSPGEVAMGVYGTLSGASNKEPMSSNKDNLIGFEIKKKKKVNK